MSLRAIIVAVAVAALAGCGIGHPARAGSPGPGPASRRSPRPAADVGILASTASWPHCTREDVQVAARGDGAGLGHVGVEFTLHNTSASGCRLFGFPSLRLLGPRGQPLPTTVVRAVSGAYLFPAVVPHWVALRPDGFASFDLEYGDNPAGSQASEPYATACPMARQAKVILPGAREATVVRVTMAPCGGDVLISPVVPGLRWLAFQ
jgi:hypothetical protein